MKKLILVFSLMLAMIVSSYAQSSPNVDLSNMKAVMPNDPNVKSGTLKNGMKYFIRKNSKPENRAHFRLLVDAGSIDEDDDQLGLAHFCEHMAFNGSKHFPKNELLDFMQKAGVTFGGDLNASTSYEQTMYELPIPLGDEKLLKSSFQVLQDWAQNLNYEDKDIDDERGIIVSEWRQRNNFQFRLQDNSMRTILKGSKFEKRNIIGDTNILLNFPYETIRRFYRDWYRPNLMAIVAVGDFDVDKIELLIKEYFEVLKNPTPSRQKDVVVAPYHKETYAYTQKDKELPIELGEFYFNLPEFPTNTLEGYRETLKRGLFDIMLNERLGEIAQLPEPPYIQCGAGESKLLAGIRSFVASFSAQPGNFEKAFNTTMEELVRVKQHGFTATELERAKTAIKSQYEKMYAGRQTVQNERYVNEYTNVFFQNDAAPGIAYESEFVNKVLPNITVEEINALGNLYIRPDNAVVLGFYPESSEKTFSKDELIAMFNAGLNKNTTAYIDKSLDKPLFTKDVKPGKITDKKIDKKLDITEYTLANGAKVLVKKTNFKDDEVNFSAVSHGGLSMAEDKDYLNASFATTIVGNSGVGAFDNTELEKALVGKNVRLAPYIEEYSEGFHGSSSKKDLETMLQLTNLYFTEPRKDKKAFLSVRNKIKSQLQNKANNSESVFEDSVTVALYGNHLRKRPVSAEDLNGLDLNTAYEFYKSRFNAANDFEFVLVGDLDVKETESLIEKYIGSLPANGKTEKAIDRGIRVTNKGVAKTYVNGDQDRAQVRIVIPAGFSWSAEARQRVKSMTDLLEIKLLENVREKLGGVYSPSVYPMFEKFPTQQASIVIEYVCKPNQANDVVKATFDVFDIMKKDEDKVGTEKVRKAQENQREVMLKSNNFWSGNIPFYIENGDDMTEILNYDKYVKSLKPSDIKTEAKKILNRDKAIVVINQPTIAK